MPGGRRTHAFPNGQPKPLIAIEVATVVSWFAWAIYAPSLVTPAVLRALTVLRGVCSPRLTELALVRRWALLRPALIRPGAAVPVPLLVRVLGVVVPAC